MTQTPLRLLVQITLIATVGSVVAGLPATAHAAPLAPIDASTSDSGPGDDFLETGGIRTQAAFEPRIETSQRERPVAPGVTLRSFDRYGPDGFTGAPNWLQADSLSVDLTKGTTVDYLFPGQVAKGEALSTQAARVGAVAAVNGDFFDINNSTAPLGVGIRSGELIESPDGDPTWRRSAAIFTPDGIGSIGEVFFEGRITLPAGQVPLAGVNKPTLNSGAIEAFTPLWGTYCRCRATQGAAQVTEVEVINNRVTAIRPQAGDGPIPTGGLILVGRETGATALAALQVGDQVSVDYQARTGQGQRITAAVNGRQLLVINGVPQKASQGSNVPAAPRTALGFSQDGKKMFLLTADGRQPAFADGLGLDELASMMIELGAYHAVNLDGGGSTTIVAREPGSPTPQVENRPSDGGERPVPNGLALFGPQGSGQLQGFWVETALDSTRASGASTVASARTDRVFPGLTRTLTAAGYDETFGPAAGTPRWRTGRSHVGTVDDAGVFHANRPGTTTATAFRGPVRGQLQLTVLDALARLESTSKQVALTGQGESSTVGIVGYDRNGFGAPIEPADIQLSYDHGLLDIVPAANGQLTVTGKQPSGSALVTVEAGGVRTILPVTVGLDEVTIADFDNPTGWQFFGERAPGTLTPVPGRTGGGLRLTYDFAQTTQIRTGGALAPAGLRIPGQPRALRLWVNSTGKGEWASLQVWDGNGTLLPAFRAGFLTYTGWRQLEFTVPPGTVYPLTLRRFYNAETRADAQYQGDVIIDQLTAMVPPSIDVPREPTTADPVIVQDGTVAGARWRFAVMSDAQFVARDPDSDIVRNARRTLREIKAAHPDFLIINGDFVDEATTADFALAKRILDEELAGQLTYYYVPGNHERFDNSVNNFRAVFGDSERIFDHNGTRFITVDTSGISLRASDWTQLRTLRTELDKAARDRTVRSVVLVEHVPRATRPRPAPASCPTARKPPRSSPGSATSRPTPARTPPSSAPTSARSTPRMWTVCRTSSTATPARTLPPHRMPAASPAGPCGASAPERPAGSPPRSARTWTP